MKVFLLAAGLGTRLKPLTYEIPKCLVPIGGKPLISYWFTLFKKYGLSDVLINLHHLPHKLEEFLNERVLPVNVITFFEKELLGSAGTVMANKDWVCNDKFFLIAYADNLTNVNLGKLIDYHVKEMPVLTMALFRSDFPKECGIATLDKDQTIIDFTEKPKNPSSNFANAGIYITGKEIFDYIPKKEKSDFGCDVLPNLIGQMKGFLINDYLLDIGNIERYQQAQRDIKRISF